MHTITQGACYKEFLKYFKKLKEDVGIDDMSIANFMYQGEDFLNEEYYDDEIGSAYLLYVYVDNTIVGHMMMNFNDDDTSIFEDKYEYVLSSIFISRSYRMMGLASSLIKYAKELYGSEGIIAQPVNKGVRRFFVKNSFPIIDINVVAHKSV